MLWRLTMSIRRGRIAMDVIQLGLVVKCFFQLFGCSWLWMKTWPLPSLIWLWKRLWPTPWCTFFCHGNGAAINGMRCSLCSPIRIRISALCRLLWRYFRGRQTRSESSFSLFDHHRTAEKANIHFGSQGSLRAGTVAARKRGWATIRRWSPFEIDISTIFGTAIQSLTLDTTGQCDLIDMIRCSLSVGWNPPQITER